MLFLLSLNVCGQRIGMGARAVAMANSAVSLQDGWAIFNNIGTLAWVEETQLLAAVDNRFTISGLNTVAAGAIQPLFKGKTVAGASISHFGDHLFNEVNLGLGLSHRIDKVSLGLKVNYVQFAMQGLQTKTAIAVEFGGLMQFTKHLFVAAHIYNLNQAQIASFKDERLPTIMKAGISYRPLDNITLNAEAVKDIDYPTNVRAGAEYKPISKLAVRGGFSVNPLIYNYGVGLEVAGFHFDYALSTHTTLLPAHHLSVAYRFRKLKPKT